MMTALTKFKFKHEEFGNIRVVLIDGVPWLVGKDVAKALGYTNPQKAIRDHVEDEDKMVNGSFTLGRGSAPVLINESGMYQLIFSSKMPQAKQFTHWVTCEVLPAIRQSGMYTTAQIIEQIFKSADAAEFLPESVFVVEMNNGTIKFGFSQDFLRYLRQIELGSGLTIVKNESVSGLQADVVREIKRACLNAFIDDRILGEFCNTSFDDATAVFHRVLSRKAELL